MQGGSERTRRIPVVYAEKQQDGAADARELWRQRENPAEASGLCREAGGELGGCLGAMQGGSGRTQRIPLVLQGSGEVGKCLSATQGSSGKVDPSGLGRAAGGARQMPQGYAGRQREGAADTSGLCRRDATRVRNDESRLSVINRESMEINPD